MARAIVETLSSFTTATNLDVPRPFRLPQSCYSYLGNIIEELESGCITMIEANTLKSVHKQLHHIMVKAVKDDWKVTLIDLANCFNPQQISSIAFEYDIHGKLVLEQIGIARPFQAHQAASIIKNLVSHIGKNTDRRQLIIVTDISSLFFDLGIKNEDPQFPIPQLEMMRQSVGILQSLAVQGHTVLITDQSERLKSVMNLEDPPQIKAASLRYSAKVHVVIHEEEGQRMIQLKAHPFFGERTEIIDGMQTILTVRPKRQLSLGSFF